MTPNFDVTSVHYFAQKKHRIGRASLLVVDAYGNKYTRVRRPTTPGEMLYLGKQYNDHHGLTPRFKLSPIRIPEDWSARILLGGRGRILFERIK